MFVIYSNNLATVWHIFIVAPARENYETLARAKNIGTLPSPGTRHAEAGSYIFGGMGAVY